MEALSVVAGLLVIVAVLVAIDPVMPLGVKRNIALSCLVLAICLCAIVMSACSISIERAEGRVFTKDVRQAERTAADQGAVIRLLLCGGYPPDAVEAILRGRGISPEESHRLVAIAAADRSCPGK